MNASYFPSTPMGKHPNYPQKRDEYETKSEDSNRSRRDLGQIRIIDLTVAEFLSILDEHKELTSNSQTDFGPEIPAYVYGLSGLAKLLGCSDTTAWRIKKSGRLNPAIHQYGKTTIFDARKVLELARLDK